MKILIDIPDNEYNLIMGSDKTCNADSCSKELMMHAIKNGIPSPTLLECPCCGYMFEYYRFMRDIK